MKILVINCGSSSVKYQLIDTEKELALAKGMVARIGMSGSVLTHKPHDRPEVKVSGEILDHIVAIEYVVSMLMSQNHGVIEDRSEIEAIGHRVVQVHAVQVVRLHGLIDPPRHPVGEAAGGAGAA